MTEKLSPVERALVAAAAMPAPAARKILMLICESGLVTMPEVPQLTEGQRHYAKREKIINRMQDSIDRICNYVKHETLRNTERHFRQNPPVTSAEAGTDDEAQPSSLAARLTFEPQDFRAELLAALREESAAALGVAGQGLYDEIGRDDPFKLPDKQAIKFMDTRENLMSKVPDEIHSDIMTAIQNGLEEGESRKGLMDRISTAFREVKKTRAKTIAHTETAAAFNFARNLAMKKAGVEYKKWLHSQSPLIKEPRPTHVENDGQIVPVDEPFDISGIKFMYPTDDSLGAGPEDIINCHCVAIPTEAPIESGDLPGHEFHGNQWTGTIEEPVFHGGKSIVKEPKLEESQQRDYGFYGKGFYVTSVRNYAKSYGGKISEYTVDPKAKVLFSSLTPEKAPEGLVDEVIHWKKEQGMPAAVARGKVQQFEDELKSIRTDLLEWKNAVDAYGEAHGFDIVHHSKGEVAVKNPSVLKLKPK